MLDANKHRGKNITGIYGIVSPKRKSSLNLKF